MTSSAQQDESAVAAVRRGDAERYRELVERHERRVYAVAWSRLGDAALAEEAMQEAFIRAYRRLWLLGDGAKFAAWITTIARHAAINLGLRHRRELNKRERWALEQPAATSPTTGETTEFCTPETLRQTLAELPAAHRECLVLFYLEGKSGAEAAAALGISETALRVRLHRARAAIRERLEEKLEGSLAKLRPAKTLVPAIMAAVMASSSAKVATAGGTGAAILGALAKFTPFKWLFTFIPMVFIPLIMISPVMMWPWARFLVRDAQRNYRDPKGFRASLHRQFDQSHLVFFVFIIGMIFVFVMMTTHVLGVKGFKDCFLILGFFTLVVMGFAARHLEIDCSRFQIGVLLNGLFMSGVYLGIGLGWLPNDALFLAIALSSLFTIFTNCSRPPRMDYNLFLRATQGMLPPTDLLVQKESSIRFDRAELRAFARFLGERQLAGNFGWGTDGLILYLPAVKSPKYFVETWNSIFPSVRNTTNITLGWDGSVAARCGKKDAADLEALRSNSASDPTSLQNQVAMAVSQAWRNFREGKIAFAERAIGQIPDTEIFAVPPIRTRANRFMIILWGCLLIFFLIEQAPFFQLGLSGLEPVSVTETEVRAFLGGITTYRNPIINNTQRSYPGDPTIALDFCLVLPPTNLFSPDGLQATRQEVLRAAGFNPGGTLESKYERLANSWLLGKAMVGGWLSLDELGVDSSQMSESLHNPKPYGWKLEFMLVREKAWSWVDGKRWDVERINDFTLNQLRWLRDVNCLDLVDREKLIRQIAPVQVLSGTPPGQPPIHAWRDVRGLFFTPSWPALQDTYFSLAALEILGGLDKIDREACIKGILKRHQGKGWFTSPNSGGFNEYHIDGSERDTIAAFESLRILGALDRVKDLEKWQFRPKHRDGDMDVTWQDVEAWVCQQRLEKILRERKENPQAPMRSLLDP
jgi:RNA polymerase sigma-70 factor (ECF subfamily)